MIEPALAKATNGVMPQRGPGDSLSPEEILEEVGSHVLRDGFRLVVDLRKSHGCRLVDALSGREFLDFYGGHGSMMVGFNHPWFERPAVKTDLELAVKTKLANADLVSGPYARFVKAFSRVLGLAPLDRYFFIEGGALAVENALKAAMDWKVRKNLAAGNGPRGTEILHFERAFHGRSGYTLSLTNTDPVKTDYFPKFPWPRVSSPWIDFSLNEPERTKDLAERERAAEERIRKILQTRGPDIAAIVIEPIQSEGGDNHFRGEWLRTLRRLCDEYEVMLIFDEVQTGAGGTGRPWCCEHFDVLPDLLAFGKKVQVCGVMAGPRLDEVPDNCFRLSGRINSTWGGNLADMARAVHLLEVVEQERLLENAQTVGALLLEGLSELAQQPGPISAPRGRGLLVAFDLPSPGQRDAFYAGLFDLGLLTLKCGPRSIRFRPPLDVTAADAREAIGLIRQQCRRLPAL
jgi:L-lysine 6-transaminase